MDEEMYKERLRILEDQANRINAVLNTPPKHDDAVALMDRLSELPGYVARTGEMLAEVEYILTVWRGEALSRLLKDDPKMPAGQQRVLVDAECAYAIKVQRLIERANRSATHAQEACITQVSYAKEEMSLARKGY